MGEATHRDEELPALAPASRPSPQPQHLPCLPNASQGEGDTQKSCKSLPVIQTVSAIAGAAGKTHPPSLCPGAFRESTKGSVYGCHGLELT